jgi:2-polyprenyl-3-methyl-5-hydroxy-6-metoxy-1,4-benzoquinol methylase
MNERIRVISALREDDSQFDLSDARALDALQRAEDAHFWHRSRNAFIGERLSSLGATPPARVVELGCGSGCVSAALARAGYAVVGVDGHARLLHTAARRAPQASFWQHDLARGTSELPERGFDVAALFDVIEHLDAPEVALRAALELVRPGGLVVGTVPASMRLWSVVDERAGHRLRYDRASLARLLDALAGARRVELTPFFRALFPLLWVQRRRVSRQVETASEDNLAVPPLPIDLALGALCRAERLAAPLLDRAEWLGGASLWFALRRCD